MVVFLVFATIVSLYGDFVADFAFQDRQSFVVCLARLHQRPATIVCGLVFLFLESDISELLRKLNFYELFCSQRRLFNPLGLGFSSSKDVAYEQSLHLLLYTIVIQYMGHDPNLSSNYGFTQALEICLEKGSLSKVYICMIF
ncbi:hypothetical protein Hanom_Chr07g00635671 [Helianthus anomalus]